MRYVNVPKARPYNIFIITNDKLRMTNLADNFDFIDYSESKDSLYICMLSGDDG